MRTIPREEKMMVCCQRSTKKNVGKEVLRPLVINKLNDIFNYFID